jgi:hypothetical protein
VFVVAVVALLGLTSWFPPQARLSYFLLGPVFAILGVYLGLAPQLFAARRALRAIEASSTGLNAWRISALPMNVATIRHLVKGAMPRASLSRATFIAFSPDSLSVWIKYRDAVYEVLREPRASVRLVRVIQNGTRTVINLGPLIGEKNQLVLIASKGTYSLNPGSLTNGADFITTWIRHEWGQRDQSALLKLLVQLKLTDDPDPIEVAAETYFRN